MPKQFEIVYNFFIVFNNAVDDRNHNFENEKSLGDLVVSSSKQELIDRLMSMSKIEIIKQSTMQVKTLQSKLTDAAADIAQKDMLISELSLEKEQNALRRDKILTAANDEAKRIIMKAKEVAEEANETSRRKIANAEAEANSIVDARLNSAKREIQALEDQRASEKRKTSDFFKNIAGEYDLFIQKTEGLLANIKDMQEDAELTAKSVEAEKFTKFNITDYVSPTSPINLPFDSTNKAATLIDEALEDPDEIVLENKEIALPSDELAELNSALGEDPIGLKDEELKIIQENGMFGVNEEELESEVKQEVPSKPKINLNIPANKPKNAISVNNVKTPSKPDIADEFDELIDDDDTIEPVEENITSEFDDFADYDIPEDMVSEEPTSTQQSFTESFMFVEQQNEIASDDIGFESIDSITDDFSDYEPEDESYGFNNMIDDTAQDTDMFDDFADFDDAEVEDDESNTPTLIIPKKTSDKVAKMRGRWL